ncbi:MAG: ACT domain-containing protein [Candidatus Bathyarchaeota archaeon]
MLPVFAGTVVKEHPDDYMVVSIGPGYAEEARRRLSRLQPFSSVTYDHSEVSVVLRSSEWANLKHHFPGAMVEGPYRIITFDIVLDLSLVGFLSVVSGLLAENGVSIYALSTYLRDHILVRKGDAPKAVELLNGLVERSRKILENG